MYLGGLVRCNIPSYLSPTDPARPPLGVFCVSIVEDEMNRLKNTDFTKWVFGVVAALLVAAAVFATNPLSSRPLLGESFGYPDSDGVPGPEPLLW
jgi:hypothetical protein